ncbi:MAG: hypothetical protein EHM64_12035 [Ignavibacteriae bacterium]|nr:MAG: hypothetical protein EHM64_12035 [Ignavibacteriota bacterium]
MPILKFWLIQNPVRINRIFFSIIIPILVSSIGFARPMTGSVDRQGGFVQTPRERNSNVQSRNQDAVVLRPAAKSLIEAKPGSITPATFKIINLSSEQQTFKAEMILPKGWKPVTREFPFDLTAGESDVRLTTFSIPSDAPAGKYTIRYKVRDQASPVHEAVASIDVVVVRVIQFELKLLNAPRFVIGGAVFPTDILISNQGNSSGAFRLRVKSSRNYQVRLDSSIVHLAPKETRQLQLFITCGIESDKIKHTLELEAISLQDTTIRSKISSIVDVIPRSTTSGNEFIEFPVMLKLTEVGQDGKFAPQVEVSGTGSLTEGKTDRLEFLFRGPETQNISTLGLRDEYRISYSQKNFEIHVGDQSYSLSTLTEAGRYATGFGGKVKFGSMAAGGFYNSTRWTTQSQKEGGGFLSYDAMKGATLSLNYLNKREQYSTDIVSFRGLFTPFTGSAFDLEYGTGVKDGKKDQAYAAHLVGTQRWISYDLRFVNAGPNYGGYYRDINFLSSSVNIQPVRNVRIDAYLRQEKRNLLRDTNQVYAPLDNSYQVGIGYSNYFSVHYRRNTQEDRFDSSKYRIREDEVQSRIGYNFSFASMYVNYDYGIRRDELLHKESPTRTLALYLTFNPVASQNYSTAVEYTKLKDIYTEENQERISASLNAWIFFGQSTQAQLNVYGSRILGSIVQTYSMFEASIEHVFPFNHKIRLHGRYNIFTPAIINNQTAYSLDYEIPIGVPFRRVSGIGQLRGSMVDEQGKGLANVLISVGSNSALTDRKGNFYFPALKPGPNFVVAELGSIGFNRTTKQPMPMEVIIRGGEETTIVLSVTRTITVSGIVTMFNTHEHEFGDTSTALVDAGGKSGVFLEISNGTEINRRVSDNKGKFLFADMRPGSWTLKIIGGDIPENYKIDPEEININLAAGEKTDVKFQLKPRRRTIKMIEPAQVVEVTVPTVVKKAVVPPPPMKAEKKCIVIASLTNDGYILQISSWVTKTKARRMAKKAANFHGLKAYVMTEHIPSLGIRYRVYIGVFGTREDAVEFCQNNNFE